MKKADPRKLVLAKAELKRAMRASNPNPKRIARAAAKVAIANPAFTDVLFCHLKLIPLFMKLLKSPRFKSLDVRVLRAMIKAELEKVEQKYKVQLSLRHKRIATSVFIKTLRKFWKKGQKNNKRKNKKR